MQTKTVNNDGADFDYDNQWGVMDLYCKNGNVYLNEYYGQTSIFMNTCTPTLGTNEVLQNNNVSVLQNPAQNYLSIHSSSQNVSEIIIYDLNGIIAVPVTKILSDNTIDVSALTNGFYVLSIKSNGTELKSKLIIQK
ncbi:MAG: T9SS type A sorting domain-containing protein [Bacteroidia bacterium]|nr:T9SS type A sorting domain-containing protein [Bacteroidia bacterium]